MISESKVSPLILVESQAFFSGSSETGLRFLIKQEVNNLRGFCHKNRKRISKGLSLLDVQSDLCTQ